jgi:hypothetical protein
MKMWFPCNFLLFSTNFWTKMWFPCNFLSSETNLWTKMWFSEKICWVKSVISVNFLNWIGDFRQLFELNFIFWQLFKLNFKAHTIFKLKNHILPSFIVQKIHNNKPLLNLNKFLSKNHFSSLTTLRYLPKNRFLVTTESVHTTLNSALYP